MLPKSLAPALRTQLLRARAIWDSDRRQVLKVAAGGTASPLDALSVA